ncbi:MAG: DUF5049 domain-containing protein [Clostridia bacterium]|nr:DUF5049 domain-containing protein [Clostridia bacterium]
MKMTEKIKSDLLYVRSTGLTNMFDRNAVRRIAHEFGFSELEQYVRENPKAYAHFILTGEDLPDEGGEKPKTKKLYRVTITETRKRTVTEEAECAEAAERQVQEDWEECLYLLDKSVFSSATFHAEPAEEE